MVLQQPEPVRGKAGAGRSSYKRLVLYEELRLVIRLETGDQIERGGSRFRFMHFFILPALFRFSAMVKIPNLVAYAKGR